MNQLDPADVLVLDEYVGLLVDVIPVKPMRSGRVSLFSPGAGGVLSHRADHLNVGT